MNPETLTLTIKKHKRYLNNFYPNTLTHTVYTSTAWCHAEHTPLKVIKILVIVIVSV